MLSWESLIVRADEVMMKELVGPELVTLLSYIDKDLVALGSLRDILSRSIPLEELLKDHKKWSLIVDLLPISTAHDLAEHLNIQDSDVYGKLKTYRATTESSLRDLLAYFGQFQSQVTPVTQVDSLGISDAKYSLFKHQREAVTAAEHILWNPGERLLLHMPTGSGKTRTAMHIIAHHLSRNENTVVVWLANSEELCSQAAEEFSIAWNSLGNREVQIGRFWGRTTLNLDEIQD